MRFSYLFCDQGREEKAEIGKAEIAKANSEMLKSGSERWDMPLPMNGGWRRGDNQRGGETMMDVWWIANPRCGRLGGLRYSGDVGKKAEIRKVVRRRYATRTRRVGAINHGLKSMATIIRSLCDEGKR